MTKSDTFYYCSYKDKAGTSKVVGFSTEAEARAKAQLLAAQKIHGTIERRCELQEVDHYENGLNSNNHRIGKILSQEIIDYF